MDTTLNRVLDALHAGQPTRTLALRLVGSFALTGVLCVAACLFMAMEPARGSQSPQEGVAGLRGPMGRQGAAMASYTLLKRPSGPFAGKDRRHG